MPTRKPRCINLAETTTPRRGLSTLEVMGCLIALVGGLVIGAAYLGVDLPSAAQKLLGDAGFIEQVEPQPETAQPEQMAADAAGEIPNPGPTPAETRTASVAYWKAVDRILDDHSSLKQGAAQKWTGQQNLDYLSARQKVHRETADKLAELDTLAVDPRLLEFGEKMRSWHENGSELFQEAINISLGSPTGEFSGPHRSAWVASMKQQQMEKALLMKRKGAIRAYVRGTFLSGTTAPATE